MSNEEFRDAAMLALIGPVTKAYMDHLYRQNATVGRPMALDVTTDEALVSTALDIASTLTAARALEFGL